MDRRAFLAVSAGLFPLHVLGQNVVMDVCKQGQQNECRYLGLDEENNDRPTCLKLTPFRQIIDEEVQLYLKECGGYPLDDVPLGDNCAGCLPPMELWS